MHWMDWSGGWMMILWWGIIIAVVYFVVKAIIPQKGEMHKEDSAIEILKKRYARGEISKEEFNEKKNDVT